MELWAVLDVTSYFVHHCQNPFWNQRHNLLLCAPRLKTVLTFSFCQGNCVFLQHLLIFWLYHQSIAFSGSKSLIDGPSLPMPGLFSKCSCNNERFEILQSNPLFNVINVFDCRQWQKGANLWSLGENEITELINNFNVLLTKNNCNTDRIMTEWDLLKLELTAMTASCEKINYLKFWSKVFTSDDKESYKNVLRIIEVLLITSTMNAKLKRMFSHINRLA